MMSGITCSGAIFDLIPFKEITLVHQYNVSYHLMSIINDKFLLLLRPVENNV